MRVDPKGNPDQHGRILAVVPINPSNLREAPKRIHVAMPERETGQMTGRRLARDLPGLAASSRLNASIRH